MMEKTAPKLVVMAAGMGSRFGGLKQMENVTDEGEVLLDFACYDAVKAGFEEIIFIIKGEMEDVFRDRILSRMESHVKTSYVFQSLDMLPEGYDVPEGREKPWGTCHAVLCAADAIGDAPFAVINSDDYYGRDAFKKVFDFLSREDGSPDEYCMAGYFIENTLSDKGTVTRGVCVTDDEDFLTGIDETKELGWKDVPGGEICAGDTEFSHGTVVSMNFWGFRKSALDAIADGFPDFLEGAIKDDPLKGEYLLPIKVSELLDAKKASVKVLKASDRWYGMTYKEDKDTVRKALSDMKGQGIYPERLWD